MCGHVEFAAKILILKPELVSEVDSNGFSPLHLASLRKNVDMVRLLLALLIGLADSWSDPTVCVNSRDAHGNTILHLAVARRQMKMIEYLVNTSLGIEINALNKNGFTAVDILANHIIKEAKDTDIEQLLRCAGGLSAREQAAASGNSQTIVITTPQPSYYGMNAASSNDNTKSDEERYNDWLTDKQNILMVVAVVFGKMTRRLNFILTPVCSIIMQLLPINARVRVQKL
ncbi:hypothetical protein MKW92_023364 [Papaver armeniacum]|nr:hypothetical protein MKW92_023364 [Papaver armeniacum]